MFNKLFSRANANEEPAPASGATAASAAAPAKRTTSSSNTPASTAPSKGVPAAISTAKAGGSASGSGGSSNALVESPVVAKQAVKPRGAAASMFEDLEVKDTSAPAPQLQSAVASSNSSFSFIAAGSTEVSAPTTPQQQSTGTKAPTSNGGAHSPAVATTTTSASSSGDKPKKKKRLQAFEFQRQGSGLPGADGGEDDDADQGVPDTSAHTSAAASVSSTPTIAAAKPVEQVQPATPPVPAVVLKDEQQKDSIAKVSVAAPAAPAAPAPAAPTEEKMIKLDKQLGDLDDEQRSLLQQLEKTFMRMAQNSVLLRQTDDRQVAAAESEDFALAERLNEELERYQLELETMSETVDTLNETLAKLHARKDELITAKLLLFSDYEAELSATSRKEHSELQSIKSKIIAHKQKERTKIDLERDRIDRLQSHMKLDKELVDKSEASLQEKIRADGKPHFDELETLQARHSSVSLEVDDLRRRLNILIKEQESLQSQIVQAQKSIDSIAENYAAERVRIDKEKAILTKSQLEFEEAQKSFAQAESAFKSTLEELIQTEHAHSQLVQIASSKQQAVSSLRLQDKYIQATIDSYRLEVKAKNNEREVDRLQIAKLVSAVDQAETVVKTKSHLVETRTKALSDKQHQLNDLKSKLSLWTQQKAAAAAERNFKEAGRIAVEIKSAQTTVDEGETVLTELKQAIDDAQSELEEARAAKRSSRSKVDNAEKSVAQEKLGKLEPQLVELKANYSSIVNDPAKYDETVLLRARIIANAALVVKLRANLGINVDKAVTEAFNIGSEPSKPTRSSLSAAIISATASAKQAPVGENDEADEQDQQDGQQSESIASISNTLLSPERNDDELEQKQQQEQGSEESTPSHQAGDVSSSKKELLFSREELELLKQRDEELNQKIGEAAEAEDYDLADSLNNEQVQVQQQIKELENLLSNSAKQDDEPALATESFADMAQGSAAVESTPTVDEKSAPSDHEKRDEKSTPVDDAGTEPTNDDTDASESAPIDDTESAFNFVSESANAPSASSFSFLSDSSAADTPRLDAYGNLDDLPPVTVSVVASKDLMDLLDPFANVPEPKPESSEPRADETAAEEQHEQQRESSANPYLNGDMSPILSPPRQSSSFSFMEPLPQPAAAETDLSSDKAATAFSFIGSTPAAAAAAADDDDDEDLFSGVKVVSASNPSADADDDDLDMSDMTVRYS